MPPLEEKKATLLSRDALVPLGLTVSVVLAATAGVWSFSRTLNEFQSEYALRFQRLEIKLDSLDRSIVDSSTDRWRKQDMRQWADVLQAKNQNLSIPEVK